MPSLDCLPYTINQFHSFTSTIRHKHQGREIIAIVALENGAFCIFFIENFHEFRYGTQTFKP